MATTSALRTQMDTASAANAGYPWSTVEAAVEVLKTAVDGVVSAIGGAPSATATTTNVTASASSVTLKAANADRNGLTVYNNADKALHLSFATPATTDNAVAMLAAESGTTPGGYYEVPYRYTGAVYGIWEASPTGKANVTEIS